MKATGIILFVTLLSFARSHAQSGFIKTTEELIVENAPFKQCHASTLCEPTPGKLLAAWFGGTHEGNKDVEIWLSVQEKGRWSQPVSVANGIINDTLRYPCWNPVLFKTQKGKLCLFYKVGPNPRDWWGMVKYSTNDGQSWSKAERLPNGMLGPIKNKPVQLADGTILAPSSTESAHGWKAHIERSTDEGRTWQFIPIDTAAPFDVIQPSILQYNEGRMQVLCRSKQGRVVQAWSNDKGKTWGALSATSLLNPNSGTDAVTLKNGGQLIVYNPDVRGTQWYNGRSKLHVAFSIDGQTWTDILTLENGTSEEYSYPAIIQTPDGKVHISYTYDRKNIKHVVLEWAPDAARISLIPYPASLNTGKDEFVITPQTVLLADAGFENAVRALQNLMQKAVGQPLKTVKRASGQCIVLRNDKSITNAEGYRCIVTNQQVTLLAGTPAGMFHAIETLRQLLPVAVERSPGVNRQPVPAVTISDEPVFSWRGIHLDVARHFFSIGYLEKLIDLMALYKLNKLHLHLTDDEGWRIEIKKYPALTEQGAWRTFDKNDSVCMQQAADNPDMAIDPKHIIKRNGVTMYGGFYTQQQMKALVRYAAERYIDIIPEVDMPGHMMTAIHAFPDLSCEGGSHWGELFSTPVCPCKESTFQFAQNVFTEIMDIFPSEYIHLGADEVDRKTWAQSALCQQLMQKEGLKDVAELQSYFVKRMEAFFRSKGRKLIGWDEILEGGVSSTANVMYWRSWVPNAPVSAARHGNQVIMSPGNPLYFDNLPDAHALDAIYHFNVVPPQLTAAEAKYIIGAQANLWTERVPSENRADYLYFPRLTALAERVWSRHPDFSSYEERLLTHYNRLEALQVHYRLPDLAGFTTNNVFTDSAVLYVKKPLGTLSLHYTTDESLPTPASPALNDPIVIKEPVTIKLAAFTASGLRGDIYSLVYNREAWHEATTVSNTSAGLTVNYYKKYFLNTGGMKTASPDSQFTAPHCTVPAFVTAPSFGLQYAGYIDIPETGIYGFYLLCDDGGTLTIDDKMVVNNDGQHAPTEKSGQIALKKGLHPFILNFIEAGGGFTLNLKYSKANGPVMDIPDSFLKHD